MTGACDCTCHAGPFHPCDVDGGCGYRHTEPVDEQARHRDRVTAIRRWLREIEYYLELLPTMFIEPTCGGLPVGAVGASYHSQPPADLDVLVALDPRSRPDPDDGHGIGSIAAHLAHIAGIVARRHPDGGWTSTGPVPVSRSIGYLLWVTDWAAARPWAWQLADALHTLHRHVRQLARDAPSPAIGACLVAGCGGTVYRHRAHNPTDLDPGRCNRCDRLYEGTDLIRCSAAMPPRPRRRHHPDPDSQCANQ